VYTARSRRTDRPRALHASHRGAWDARCPGIPVGRQSLTTDDPSASLVPSRYLLVIQHASNRRPSCAHPASQHAYTLTRPASCSTAPPESDQAWRLTAPHGAVTPPSCVSDRVISTPLSDATPSAADCANARDTPAASAAPLSPLSSTTRCITIPVPCTAGLGSPTDVEKQAPALVLHAGQGRQPDREARQRSQPGANDRAAVRHTAAVGRLRPRQLPTCARLR
jgi:hypothetical protein